MLSSELSSRGYPTHFPLDGRYHRYDLHSSGDGWFIGEERGGKVYASYGSWVTGEKFIYQGEGSASSEEYELFRQEVQEKALKQQDEARSAAVYLWDRGTPLGESAYLQGKKLKHLYGTRVEVDSGCTLVPMVDGAGTLWNVQRITKDGTKIFMRGARILGTYHLLPPTDEMKASGFAIAEGLATAATVHELSGRGVIVAFNLANLEAAYLEASKVHTITLVAADNDKSKGNPGLTKAKELAAKYSLKVAHPTPRDGSDWNDLMCEVGWSEARDSWRRALTSTLAGEGLAMAGGIVGGAGNPRGPRGIGEEPLTPISTITRGKAAPADVSVVNHLMASLEESGDIRRLACSQGRLFVWDGKRWSMLGEPEEFRLRAELVERAYGPGLSAVKYAAIWKTFKEKLTARGGLDLFDTPKGIVNFSNGTLYATQDAKGRYSVSFIEGHDPQDGLTHVLPYDYTDEAPARGPIHDWIATAFVRSEPGGGDRGLTPSSSASDASILQVEELFASALFPVFGHIFFLVGPSGTGKSTLADMVSELIPEEYTSFIDPQDFKGSFLLQNMIGKLVNIKNDIQYKKPLPDHIMKTICEGAPTQVNIKNKAPITTVLPKVHVFSCNTLPPTDEGTHATYMRRATIIRMDNPVGGGKRAGTIDLSVDSDDPGFVWKEEGGKDIDYTPNYGRILVRNNLGEAFGIAVRGFRRLVERAGKFTEGPESKAAIQRWLTKSSSVEEFLNKILDGTVSAKYLTEENMNRVTNGEAEYDEIQAVGKRLGIGPRRAIYSEVLYQEYSKWCSKAGMKWKTETLPEFREQMENKGFGVRLSRRHKREKFTGIGFLRGGFGNS